MRWHPQAELKDRSSPPSDVRRDCRDIRKAIQTWLATRLRLPRCKQTQLRQSWTSPASLRPVHITLSLPCGEQNGRIRRMKCWGITLPILAAMLTASLVLADDFKTNDGKEYKDATVRRVEADGIVVSTKTGISKLYFTELPKDVQQRFHYDPGNAAAAQRAAIQQTEEFNKRRSDAYETQRKQQGEQQVKQSATPNETYRLKKKINRRNRTNSRGLWRAKNLDCWRASGRRKAVRCARRWKVDCVYGNGSGDAGVRVAEFIAHMR
jgi:hypothetical protein